MNEIIAGLQILSKYANKDVAAEHDIIYVGGEASQVSSEDFLELEKLGWHVDSENRCWAIFV